MNSKLFSKRSLRIPLYGCAAYIGYQFYLANESKKDQKMAISLLNSCPGKVNGKYELKTREQHLKEVEENPEYDIVIIGGGATGAGAVLNGAAKGLRCLLLENYDFASGSSSKSTKLIHGGVRYLSDVFSLNAKTNRLENFNLVKEALQERSFMVDNALYMNKLVPIILPCKGIFEMAYYYGGSMLYHLTYSLFKASGCNVNFPLPTILGETEMRVEYPLLDPAFKWGVVYYDGTFNDARMAVDTILTSTIKNYIPGFNPANVLNYCHFDNFEKDEKGHINGVTFTDRNGQKSYKVRCKAVLNCTGVFSDVIRKMDNPSAEERMTTSEGTHIILPKRYGSRKYGICSISSDGRVTFMMPWQDFVLYGTTDNRFDELTMNPTASVESLLYLIKQFNTLFPKATITQVSTDIQAKWTGLRPLVKSSDAANGGTKAISRKHEIEETESGLISVMGGKWTIYRKMGEDSINQAIEHMVKRGDILGDSEVAKNAKKVSTLPLHLLGDFRGLVPGFRINYSHYDFIRVLAKQISESHGLDPKNARHLVRTYGIRALHLGEEIFKSKELGEKLHPDHLYLKVEVLNAIKNELILTPVDILARRTRLLFVDSKAAEEALPTVVKMMAKERGWSKENEQKELEENLNVLKKLKF